MSVERVKNYLKKYNMDTSCKLILCDNQMKITIFFLYQFVIDSSVNLLQVVWWLYYT